MSTVTGLTAVTGVTLKRSLEGAAAPEPKRRLLGPLRRPVLECDPCELVELGVRHYKCESSERAGQLFRIAAKRGSVEALFHLGRCSQISNEPLEGEAPEERVVLYREAYTLIKSSADQGCTEAQVYLGMAYEKAQLGLPYDYKEAVRLYKRAVSQGNKWAHYRLARSYLLGFVAETEGREDASEDDKKQAVSLLRGIDSPEAQNLLAFCLLKGVGVSKNFEEAMTLLQAAANKKDPYALLNLSSCYYFGTGVSESASKAAELQAMATIAKVESYRLLDIGVGAYGSQKEGLTAISHWVDAPLALQEGFGLSEREAIDIHRLAVRKAVNEDMLYWQVKRNLSGLQASSLSDPELFRDNEENIHKERREAAQAEYEFLCKKIKLKFRSI